MRSSTGIFRGECKQLLIDGFKLKKIGCLWLWDILFFTVKILLESEFAKRSYATFGKKPVVAFDVQAAPVAILPSRGETGVVYAVYWTLNTIYPAVAECFLDCFGIRNDARDRCVLAINRSDEFCFGGGILLKPIMKFGNCGEDCNHSLCFLGAKVGKIINMCKCMPENIVVRISFMWRNDEVGVRCEKKLTCECLMIG